MQVGQAAVRIAVALDALLRVPAPSGYETPAAEVWREAASFGDVKADVLGSSTVSVGVSDDRPTVAIVGHIDEIGDHRAGRGRVGFLER